MTDTVRALVALYAVNPWLDVRPLAGAGNAGRRQEILSLLTGRKVRRAESGINALSDALESALGAQGDCMAARRDDAQLRAVAMLYHAFPGSAVLAEVSEIPGETPVVRANLFAYAGEAGKLAGKQCGFSRRFYLVDAPLPWGTTVRINGDHAAPMED